MIEAASPSKPWISATAKRRLHGAVTLASYLSRNVFICGSTYLASIGAATLVFVSDPGTATLAESGSVIRFYGVICWASIILATYLSLWMYRGVELVVILRNLRQGRQRVTAWWTDDEITAVILAMRERQAVAG